MHTVNGEVHHNIFKHRTSSSVFSDATVEGDTSSDDSECPPERTDYISGTSDAPEHRPKRKRYSRSVSFHQDTHQVTTVKIPDNDTFDMVKPPPRSRLKRSASLDLDTGDTGSVETSTRRSSEQCTPRKIRADSISEVTTASGTDSHSQTSIETDSYDESSSETRRSPLWQLSQKESLLPFPLSADVTRRDSESLLKPASNLSGPQSALKPSAAIAEGASIPTAKTVREEIVNSTKSHGTALAVGLVAYGTALAIAPDLFCGTTDRIDSGDHQRQPPREFIETHHHSYTLINVPLHDFIVNGTFVGLAFLAVVFLFHLYFLKQSLRAVQCNISRRIYGLICMVFGIIGVTATLFGGADAKLPLRESVLHVPLDGGSILAKKAG